MHVVNGLGAGGMETMCLRLMQHWQHRLEQSVVALRPGPRTLEWEFRSVAGSTLTILSDGPDDFGRWRELRGAVFKHRPQAVIIHMFGVPHLFTASVARTAGVRAVACWAGNPPPREIEARRRWGAILFASRLLRCPVMSCSHAVDRELRALGLGMPAGSAAIPNGVDTNAIASQAQKTRKIRSGRAPVIGMVARLDPIKDHTTLLRAFSILRDKRPNAELWLVGDGTLRNGLEAQALRLGIAASTHFFGDRLDVPQLLGQIDVYAFSTTREEGFGIALIEAMAAGIPIAATNVAACREVLAEGDAGVLIPPESPKAFARAIIELLENDELRARKTQAAHERVQREYGVESCARRWEALLFPKPDADVATDFRCAS
ncbi:MAG: glycosyltransferase [Proteobacteria bacterium]|nr:glycosyltransferase [Pseudomonadota bacterium]